MALTYVGANTSVYTANGGTTMAPTAVANQVAGDQLILIVGTKPDTATVSTPAGWTYLGEASGGSGTTGVDTGPMKATVFTKVATSASEVPGTITVNSNNVSACQLIAFRSAAGTTMEVVGVGGVDTTGDATFAVTMPSNPGIQTGDGVVAFGVIPTDVTTPSQFTALTLSAPGLTTNTTLIELVEWDTQNGNDMGGWTSRAIVTSSGASTGAPTVSSTATGTLTNVTGPIYLVRVREITTPPISKSGSDSGTLSATESASVALVTRPLLRDFKFAQNGRNVGTTTSVSLTVQTGDVLVVKTATEQACAPTGITGGGLTWTQRAAVVGSSTQADARVWTAIANSDGIITVTASWSRTDQTRSIVAESWSGAQLAASPAIANTVDGSAPSATVTTTAADSVVTWVSADYAAVGGTATYRSGAVQEQVTGTAGTDYRTYFAWQDAPTTGANVFGLTAPTGQSPSMAGMEIQYKPSGPTDTPIVGSDTGTHSTTETAGVAGTLSASDSGTHSTTDSASSFGTMSRTDGGTTSVTESSIVFIAGTASDSGTHSTTETSAVSVVISTTDAGTFSATESLGVSAFRTLSDIGTYSVNESSASSSTLSRVDSGTLYLSDESAGVAGTITVFDSGTHNANEVSLRETPYNEVFGTDSGVHSTTESVSINATVALSEFATHSAVESTSSFREFSLTDTGTHSAADISTKVADIDLSDSGVHSATETSDVIVNDAKGVSDSGTHSATEGVSIYGAGTVADSGIHSATEESTIFKAVFLSDSGTHSVVESSVVFNDRLASDLGTHITSETATVEISGLVDKSSADSGTIIVVESTTSNVFVALTEQSTSSVDEQIIGASTANYSETASYSVDESALVAVDEEMSDSAVYSVTESAVVETRDFAGVEVHLWDGTAMVLGALRVWNGTEFITPELKIWNGGNWS